MRSSTQQLSPYAPDSTSFPKMVSSAFISSLPSIGARSSFISASVTSRQARSPAVVRPTPRTFIVKAEDEKKKFEMPDLHMPDTSKLQTQSSEVFTKFMDDAKIKVEEIKNKIENLDPEEAKEKASSVLRKLADNFLSGDVLNRGEAYGAIQLIFVLFLFKSGGILDAIFGFILGPCAILAGAAISVKGTLDLGFHQVSLWPAPVVDGVLKTDGLYSQIRHPLYAGLLLASLGYAAATGSPERFALTAALAAFLVKKIEIEEEMLEKKYPQYADYKEDVPFKIIPKVF